MTIKHWNTWKKYCSTWCKHLSHQAIAAGGETKLWPCSVSRAEAKLIALLPRAKDTFLWLWIIKNQYSIPLCSMHFTLVHVKSPSKVMLHWFVLYSKALFEHDNYSSIFASITHTHTVQTGIFWMGTLWKCTGNVQNTAVFAFIERSCMMIHTPAKHNFGWRFYMN